MLSLLYVSVSVTFLLTSVLSGCYVLLYDAFLDMGHISGMSVLFLCMCFVLMDRRGFSVAERKEC